MIAIICIGLLVFLYISVVKYYECEDKAYEDIYLKRAERNKELWKQKINQRTNQSRISYNINSLEEHNNSVDFVDLK